jgi:hypothetical protein
MTLRDSIAEKHVRFFINPFHTPDPVDFKKTLKKSSRLLIVMPALENHRILPKTLKNLDVAFPSSRFTWIHPGRSIGRYPGASAGVDKQGLNHPVLFLHLKKQTVGQLKKSQVLSGLDREPFDALLDLDPEFSLVGIYLAKLRRFPLSIGFMKPFSSRYYNIQYKAVPEATYDEKLNGLFRFIKSFVSKV